MGRSNIGENMLLQRELADGEKDSRHLAKKTELEDKRHEGAYVVHGNSLCVQIEQRCHLVVKKSVEKRVTSVDVGDTSIWCRRDRRTLVSNIVKGNLNTRINRIIALPREWMLVTPASGAGATVARLWATRSKAA
ncbi:hypothetical protein GUJ93_ZPchr0003g17740 [Zizania palustris]|uniref:Uncharacterized protein n=1 Tax=Zizania palustris TaxID=103762 RepID=A0A8J5SVI7_ZIZPA|nr:hypothetical protein GUJ93_ZPchr0003g17740 [Zizania palustris]